MLEAVLLGVSVLVLAVILDLIIGDPSPWKPWKRIYNLHPTVWLGQLTKKLEPHFKTKNATLRKNQRHHTCPNNYSCNYGSNIFRPKIPLHLRWTNSVPACCNCAFQIHHMYQA